MDSLFDPITIEFPSQKKYPSHSNCEVATSVADRTSQMQNECVSKSEQHSNYGVSVMDDKNPVRNANNEESDSKPSADQNIKRISWVERISKPLSVDHTQIIAGENLNLKLKSDTSAGNSNPSDAA